MPGRSRRACSIRAVPIISLFEISKRFELPGRFLSASRFGSGHINDTYVAVFDRDGRVERFVIQRINKQVFPDPPALMSNVERVIRHVNNKPAESNGRGHTRLACPALIMARDGKNHYRDADGEYWRAYEFIEKAGSFDTVRSRSQAREAASAFGRFQVLLHNLPGPRLTETIPEFHDTPARYRRFQEVLGRDAHGRGKFCRTEIDIALSYREAAGALITMYERGDIPERIIHNDTKINNVLFDDISGEAVCVIDLDTVMPGLSLFDFGDLVRTATMPLAEDERDLAGIEMRMQIFEALAEGYLSATAGFLTRTEIDSLAISAKVITIETGLRFLTDYLAGDEYFRIQRPDHNLDRCRTQFVLANSIDQQLDSMRAAIETVLSRLEKE